MPFGSAVACRMPAAAPPLAPATGSTTLAVCLLGSGGSSVWLRAAYAALRSGSGLAGSAARPSPDADSAIAPAPPEVHASTAPISAVRRISPSMTAPERRLRRGAGLGHADVHVIAMGHGDVDVLAQLPALAVAD